MGIPFAIVLVVGVVAALAALAWVLATRRRTAPSAAERAVTHRGGMPSPGAPSPRRGGRPVPGSRADRAEHGKP